MPAPYPFNYLVYDCCVTATCTVLAVDHGQTAEDVSLAYTFKANYGFQSAQEMATFTEKVEAVLNQLLAHLGKHADLHLNDVMANPDSTVGAYVMAVYEQVP